MSPEEKLVALLQPAEFQSRPLSNRERRYFGLRLRRIQRRWKGEWQQIAVILTVIYSGCLLGIWFSDDMPWWTAFFFLGLTVIAGVLMVLKEYWSFYFQRRELDAFLDSGTCDELRVTTNAVWVIENTGYGTCWYACAIDDAYVKLIDGGQYDFEPRLPSKEFSFRVYKHDNGSVVERRVISYGEKMQPARQFTCDIANFILDQAAYSYSGSLQSFFVAFQQAGIDLEETCPANES